MGSGHQRAVPDLGRCAASSGRASRRLSSLRGRGWASGALRHRLWDASQPRPRLLIPPPVTTQALRDIDTMLMGMGLEEPVEGEEGEEGEEAAAREAAREAAAQLGPQPRPAVADAVVPPRGAAELSVISEVD